jgi:hypothetical protein
MFRAMPAKRELAQEALDSAKKDLLELAETLEASVDEDEATWRRAVEGAFDKALDVMEKLHVAKIAIGGGSPQ